MLLNKRSTARWQYCWTARSARLYFGDDLGLTLSPMLAAGPNRRAHIYNTSSDIPFLANWTTGVFSSDIDAVVEAARSVARNQNVFLAATRQARASRPATLRVI
jgi:hypothetical protein